MFFKHPCGFSVDNGLKGGKGHERRLLRELLELLEQESSGLGKGGVSRQQEVNKVIFEGGVMGLLMDSH